MKAWMLPWLLPVGMLATVALISFSNVFGYLLAIVFGWGLIPLAGAHIRSNSPDADTDYWRIKRL